MKTIIKTLKLQLEKLNAHILKRNETYATRSAQWMFSYKGHAYLDYTKAIKTQASELEAVIEKLEDLI